MTIHQEDFKFKNRNAGTTSRRLEDGGGSRSDSSPCLYSNNSIQPPQTHPETPENKDLLSKVNQLQPGHKKSAFTLASNVERIVAVESESINHVAFLTLTFQQNITDHREAYKRFRSFNTNFLAPHPVYGHWISVKEHQARGAWHYHMIIQLTEDIRTGFDFDKYDEWLKGPRKSGTFPTGNAQIRSLWSELAEVVENYGLGRIFTLEPIKSNAEAIKYYVGKYVSKQIGHRPEADKGVRLINYSRGWLRNSVNCAWLTENSTKWRNLLEIFAHTQGCTEYYQLSEKLGPKWAHKNYDDIINVIANLKALPKKPESYKSPLISKLEKKLKHRETLKRERITPSINTSELLKKERSIQRSKNTVRRAMEGMAEYYECDDLETAINDDMEASFDDRIIMAAHQVKQYVSNKEKLEITLNTQPIEVPF